MERCCVTEMMSGLCLQFLGGSFKLVSVPSDRSVFLCMVVYWTSPEFMLRWLWMGLFTPTMWLEGWALSWGLLSLPPGLKTKFIHVANKSINHVYKLKLQQKLWTPLRGWAFWLVNTDGLGGWCDGENTEALHLKPSQALPSMSFQLSSPLS